MQRLALLFVGLITMFAGFATAAAAAPVTQSTDCQFVLGFATIHSLIPNVVGNCVTNEHYATNGDSLQQTTKGLLVWRKADNFTAFTDGYRSWVNGPLGLQERLNTERFPWEKKATVDRTEVVNFVPPTTVSQEESGSCFTSSLAATRADAYRCTVGNALMDPCFTIPGNSSALICVRNPLDSRTFVKLNLTKPLPPAEKAPTQKHPWFLQLADGTVCNFATGATFGINGERANYFCSDGWDIVGMPKTGTVWTVHEVQLPPRSLSPVLHSAQVAVKTAWQ